MNSHDRFKSLDAMRGLSAVMVVLYHFKAFSHLSLLPLVRHADLFVDFFFVLSGFVIASSYQNKLSARVVSPERFLLLRLGRIYPLHLALMAPFVLILAAKSGFGGLFWNALATNLFMLHGLGLAWIGETTLGALNFPSWSISAELAAYAAFAFTATLPRPLFRWIVGATIVLCPVVILAFSPEVMNTTFDFGIFRCLYGFALGVVCVDLYRRFDWTATVRVPLLGTLVELGVAALVLTFVIALGQTDKLTVAAPIVFAVVVLVFARDAGGLSKVLQWPACQAIGAWSYSIYMVHALVQVVMRASAFALQHLVHRPAFTSVRIGARSEDLLGVTLWQGDAATLVMLVATVALASLTFRFIEEPGRLWSRSLVLPAGRRFTPAARPVGISLDSVTR